MVIVAKLADALGCEPSFLTEVQVQDLSVTLGEEYDTKYGGNNVAY